MKGMTKTKRKNEKTEKEWMVKKERRYEGRGSATDICE